MSGTARHTKEMIEAAKKKLAASTDPVDKVSILYRVSREQLSPTAHAFRQSGATSFERGQMPTQSDSFKDGTNSS